ncbi:MAG: four helix bundle protein [Elusimicrobia bacterium]|nr:four helix bundle protein [Elusimicrobiota bacterium]
MASYKRFEELPAWKEAIDLALHVYQLTEKEPLFKTKAGLKNQLERAALSVSNNIAEGFERGTTNELLSFLYIARGSAGEVRSMLCLIEKLELAQNFKSEISNLKFKVEAISRQLRAWADSLQNSGIRGQRHFNENTRLRLDREKSGQILQAEIDVRLKEAGFERSSQI